MGRRLESGEYDDLDHDIKEDLLEQIQESLMLYGDSKDKNNAASANRNETQRTPEGTPQPPPPPTPRTLLFATPMPLVRHRLSAEITTKPTSGWRVPRTVEQLATTFQLPHLPTLLHKYLEFGRIVTIEETGTLPVELRGCLDIVTELFQTESLETLKARCSPPKHLLETGTTPVNEDIFYDDSPHSYGDFKEFAVGRILSLFVVWVPAPAQWPMFRHLGKKAFTSQQDATPHRLAYLRKFSYALGGRMRAGPEIGAVYYSRHSTAASAYCLVDIDKVFRPAQLIPDFGFDNKDEGSMRWYVNNRIDDTTWDEFFGQD